MNKKIFIVLLVLIIVLGLSFFFRDNIFSSLGLNQSYEMRGIVTLVNSDNIFVKGPTREAKSSSDTEQEKLVDLYLTSKTIYVDNATIIPKVRPQGTFSPKTEVISGSKDDLTLGAAVQVEYYYGPFQKNKAVVTKIEYTKIENEK